MPFELFLASGSWVAEAETVLAECIGAGGNGAGGTVGEGGGGGGGGAYAKKLVTGLTIGATYTIKVGSHTPAQSGSYFVSAFVVNAVNGDDATGKAGAAGGAAGSCTGDVVQSGGNGGSSATQIGVGGGGGGGSATDGSDGTNGGDASGGTGGAGGSFGGGTGGTFLGGGGSGTQPGGGGGGGSDSDTGGLGGDGQVLLTWDSSSSSSSSSCQDECMLLTPTALADLIAQGWEVISGPHITQGVCAANCCGSSSSSSSSQSLIDCEFCPEGQIASITITVAGVTNGTCIGGNCNLANGTWTLVPTSPSDTSCNWEATEFVEMCNDEYFWRIYHFNSGITWLSFETVTGAFSIALYEFGPEPAWDCHSELVIPLDTFNNICDTWPATITLMV